MNQEELVFVIIYACIVYGLLGWGVGAVVLGCFDKYPILCIVLWPIMLIVELLGEFINWICEEVKDILN